MGNDEEGMKMRIENDKGADDDIKYPGIKAMPFILGNETFERVGVIGTSSNLLLYLTTVFHMKSITATNVINIFHGTTNFAPLIGGFLCDTYFGRYKTLGFSIITSFMGLLVLALTSAIKTLHPPHCNIKHTTTTTTNCIGPNSSQMAFLMFGFSLLVVGAGGIRPCNLAFGADQFNTKTELGRKGVDSFFNWYFFSYTFAQMISLTIIVYIQFNVSWSLGLAIPVGLMLIACFLFFLGSKIYVKLRPQGSPLTRLVQVVVVAVKNRGLNLNQPRLFNNNAEVDYSSINSKLPHTNQFRFLDKAAAIIESSPMGDGSNSTLKQQKQQSGKLCTIQQVEELKCVLRVLPIWASAIIYHIPIVQMHTYAVFQALQSDRRLGKTNFKIPPASYNIFLMLTLTLWLPIYDRLVVPFSRRLTKNQTGITVLNRMGVGIVLSVLSMVVSGLVEERRRKASPLMGVMSSKGSVSSMSGMWLVPQMGLAGLSEAFMSVGQVEFYYKEFPENMRSIGGSLFFCGMGMSSYISSLLISMVKSDWLPDDLNKGKLDWFYYMVAGLGMVNFVYFLVIAKWYKYKGCGGDDGDEKMKNKMGEIQLQSA